MNKKRRLLSILVLLIIVFLGVLSCIYYKTDFFIKDDILNEKSQSSILEEKGIKLVNKDSFVEEANILLEKGYSYEEINNIYEYMSDSNIEKILSNSYTDLSMFYQIPNFEFDKIERYKAYQLLENIDMKDAVTRVNIKLDLPFYSEITPIENPNDITVLVNKAASLPSDYVPSDLVSIPSFPNLSLREVAIVDFENLLAGAKLDNVFLVPYSTYRSYEYQDGLYNKYLKTDPLEVVDTYSARAGHSEHQTGLAIDIRSNSHWYTLTDDDYEWMKNNSYKYGFIIRYPKGNSEITGYKEEPWHIRYIGTQHATKVHDLNITYDEYYDLYLTKH